MSIQRLPLRPRKAEPDWPEIAREAWVGRAPRAELRRLPLTRADCEDGPRPCPYVTCRHHLWTDVNERGGIRFNFPDLAPDELSPCCALDIIDEYGDLTLEEVALALNLTRERVRQLEDRALDKLYLEAPEE